MGELLFVGNLSEDTTPASLRLAFEVAGEVRDVQMVVDRATGVSRGFAFVTMASAEGTAKAIAFLNGSVLDEHSLHVSITQLAAVTATRAARPNTRTHRRRPRAA